MIPSDADTVAQYLKDNPQFFVDNAALLSKIQLSSPLTGRAISLQERQMEIMRDKYKTLELRMADLIRLAQENDIITNKFQVWTRSLLLARNDVDLPHALTNGLQTIFGVPHATLRMWHVAEEFCHTWFVQEVSEDAKLFASSLSAPYCGMNNDFEAVRWLEDAPNVHSAAILPLRIRAGAPAFGLLILGSPDPLRFTESMSTDFLVHIGDTASAALSCLLD